MMRTRLVDRSFIKTIIVLTWNVFVSIQAALADIKSPSQIALDPYDANFTNEAPLIADKRNLQTTFFELGNGLRLLPESTEHMGDSCNFDNMQADSLSLSADGKTIAVGYRLHGDHRCYYITAAVEVYTYSGSTQEWLLRGPPIVDAGSVVSLSADGSRLVTGEWLGYGYMFGGYTGGETVHIHNFDSALDAWAETAVIQNEFDGEKSDMYFGYGVSLSDDGQVLAVGHPGKFFGGIYYVYDDDPDYLAPGMIRVYVDGGEGVWEELGQPIVGEESAYFGTILELSSNGRVIAVASKLDYVQIYRFEDSKNNWVQMGFNIEGTVTPSSISLSADGMRAVIGFGEEQRMIAFDGTDWISSTDIGSVSVVFEETGTVISSVTTDGDEVSYRTSGKRTAVSADGTTIATATSESVHIFSTRKNTPNGSKSPKIHKSKAKKSSKKAKKASKMPKAKGDKSAKVYKDKGNKS